jgi:hypothetical protein
MARRYRKQIGRMTTAEIRLAAKRIVPLAKQALARLVERCVELSKEEKHAAPRRPPGRGSQLTATDQLLVMFTAQAMSNNPQVIATFTGFNVRTVRRVLSSTKYRKLDEFVAQQVYQAHSSNRSAFWRMIRDA